MIVVLPVNLPTIGPLQPHDKARCWGIMCIEVHVVGKCSALLDATRNRRGEHDELLAACNLCVCTTLLLTWTGYNAGTPSLTSDAVHPPEPTLQGRGEALASVGGSASVPAGGLAVNIVLGSQPMCLPLTKGWRRGAPTSRRS